MQFQKIEESKIVPSATVWTLSRGQYHVENVYTTLCSSLGKWPIGIEANIMIMETGLNSIVDWVIQNDKIVIFIIMNFGARISPKLD